MKNIVIIVHNPLVRLGIYEFFKNRFGDSNLSEYQSFEEVKSKDDSNIPDVIFMGVTEDSNGISNLKEAKNIFPDSKFIIYDFHNKSGIVIRYLRSGAFGYLSKDCELSVIEDCVNQVLAGKMYIDPTDLYSLISSVLGDCSKRGISKGRNSSMSHHKRLELTNSQHQVAKLLIEGYSTSTIAQKLGLKPSTISTVKANVFGKMRVNNIVDLKEVLESRLA